MIISCFWRSEIYDRYGIHQTCIRGIHMETKGRVVYLMGIPSNTSCVLSMSTSRPMLEVVGVSAAEAECWSRWTHCPLQLGGTMTVLASSSMWYATCGSEDRRPGPISHGEGDEREGRARTARWRGIETGVAGERARARGRGRFGSWCAISTMGWAHTPYPTIQFVPWFVHVKNTWALILKH
jgi:hypothetical protein